MFVADGGKSIKRILAPVNEPFRPEMLQYESATELGSYELWQLHLERNELCKSFLEQWNSIGNLDGILCTYLFSLRRMTKADNPLVPTTPYPAVENGKFGPYVGYTGIFIHKALQGMSFNRPLGLFNILDYSCVSFPTGLLVERTLDQLPPDTEALNWRDQHITENCMHSDSTLSSTQQALRANRT